MPKMVHNSPWLTFPTLLLDIHEKTEGCRELILPRV